MDVSDTWRIILTWNVPDLTHWMSHCWEPCTSEWSVWAEPAKCRTCSHCLPFPLLAQLHFNLHQKPHSWKRSIKKELKQLLCLTPSSAPPEVHGVAFQKADKNTKILLASFEITQWIAFIKEMLRVMLSSQWSPESAVVIDLKFKYCSLSYTCIFVCSLCFVVEIPGLCFNYYIYVLKTWGFFCYCYLSVTSYFQEHTYYIYCSFSWKTCAAETLPLLSFVVLYVL